MGTAVFLIELYPFIFKNSLTPKDADCISDHFLCLAVLLFVMGLFLCFYAGIPLPIFCLFFGSVNGRQFNALIKFSKGQGPYEVRECVATALFGGQIFFNPAIQHSLDVISLLGGIFSKPFDFRPLSIQCG